MCVRKTICVHQRLSKDLHPSSSHPLPVHSKGRKVVPHKRDSGVQQSPLHGGLQRGVRHNDANEGRLEQLVSIEGKVPHEPGQGCA